MLGKIPPPHCSNGDKGLCILEKKIFFPKNTIFVKILFFINVWAKKRVMQIKMFLIFENTLWKW